MALGTSHFRVITLWRGKLQFLFSARQIPCQKVWCQIMANVGVKRFHIVRIVALLRFPWKQVFVKLKTFSSAKKTKNEIKPMRDSESTSKIKVRPRKTFFEILLMSAVICIQKVFNRNEMYNIFKSKNATKLTKTIIESSYKVLLDKSSFVTVKQSMPFLWAVEFLATFNL